MVTPATGLTPFLDDLQSISSGTKHVAFTDDLADVGKSHHIKSWWDHLQVKGPKYGCYPKPSKTYILVKHQYEQNAEGFFSATNINMTVSVAKHLGAIRFIP